MVNERTVKIGDIVAYGGHFKIFKHNKCSTTSFGVVVGFTCNNNPRVCVLPYKMEVRWSVNNPMRHYTTIMLDPVPYDKDLVLSRGGELVNNYNKIIKLAKDYEQSKNESIRPRKKAKVDLSRVSF